MTKYIMHLGLLLYIALSDTPVCQAQTTEDNFLKKGAVLGFHFIKPKEGEDAYKHEAFLKQKYSPSWRDAMLGSQVYYLKGERGMSQEKILSCGCLKTLLPVTSTGRKKMWLLRNT